MKIKFQNVRNLMASLIGNPNVPEAMVAELDSAIKGDEASTEEMLASVSNVSQSATETTTTVAETVTAENTAIAAVTEIVTTANAETVTAPVAVVETQKTGLELVLEKMTAIENRQNQVEAENRQLKAENAELRAGASPRGVVPQTENQANVIPARVNRTSEKDERRAEDISRLKEKFPELMHDIE